MNLTPTGQRVAPSDPRRRDGRTPTTLSDPRTTTLRALVPVENIPRTGYCQRVKESGPTGRAGGSELGDDGDHLPANPRGRGSRAAPGLRAEARRLTETVPPNHAIDTGDHVF